MSTPTVIILNPRVHPDQIGFLPGFLDTEDERPAAKQIDANYGHGGGWRPMKGFELKDMTLQYPGDPPLDPIAVMTLRKEMIAVYPYGIVAIIQADGEFEVCRCD